MFTRPRRCPAAISGPFAAASALLVAAPALSQAPPDSIFLSGVIRDFQDTHPDFEAPDIIVPGKKYIGFLVEPAVSPTSFKPLLNVDGSGNVQGFIVTKHWENIDDEPISYATYDPFLDEIDPSDPQNEGVANIPSDGAIDSEYSFNQWYTDWPGVNISMWVEIEAGLQADGTYVFDSAVDEPYATLGGFFPIDDDGWGAAPPGAYKPTSPSHNYHFTFEGHWRFRYDDTAGHFFTFTGDDDVFVFINGDLVIDIGGTHWPREQSVEVDRLGLLHDEIYRMDFFYAERHCCASNMRFQTNMPLIPDPPPPLSTQFD